MNDEIWIAPIRRPSWWRRLLAALPSRKADPFKGWVHVGYLTEDPEEHS